ncbi:NACHT domain-containing protein [Nonomuraea pusilla]|uniref:NACHT domain-containing protein n=1 Tax=Nonomuraea pusilla TaxID=46177 RepID=UPI0033327AFF
MPGIEAAVAAAGKAVAERAAREWLAARAARRDRASDLKDLVQSGFRDRIAARKFANQLEGVALAVEGRLSRLVEQEFAGLDESARAAVLLDVVAALRTADLSDAALFDADADPAELAGRVVAGLPAPAGLGEAEQRLYGILLAESVDCLAAMMRQLPQFLPRAATESLTRLSGLAEGVERLLARLPARSLEAPEGSQDDAAYERLYLRFVSRTLDEVELFGVRVENFRPRTSLSVAYISLAVSAGERGPSPRPERLSPASLTGRQDVRHGTERVERALGRSRLVLLRGEAGSGKSTLLRWLAVTAARGGFTDALEGWNGCVPLVIKLRSHAGGRFPAPPEFLNDVAQEVAGRMPRGWTERVLESGRALLLVDGVDELPPGHRPAAREWLSRLLKAYPATRVVVTSRPTAADARWLRDEGFAPAMLEPMTPEDLRELVRQWHVAMRDCPSLPCEAAELEGYEAALLARMEAHPHLRVLASIPLLAAMLCALNLDRRTHLPRSRMGLYEAVLDLLLDRRDAERRIADEVSLDPEQKVWILRDLAWRLVSMGRSELSKATALRRVEQRLASMTRMPYAAGDVLDHLLRRSGVLREPVPGRVDFAHRTVQEYLAAGQLVEDEDVEAAVERAHLDQWREVVVMAAGHAGSRLRGELLAGLLDRADRGGRHARRLRLLVAACLETVQEIPVALRDRIEGCLAQVIPPRTVDEARTLAAAGEEILRRLPDDLSGLPERAAAMTVRTAWLINGEESLTKLSRYASDGRSSVRREIDEGWLYFDADVYAHRVLTGVPLLRIQSTRQLRGLAHLGGVRSLRLRGEPITDLGFLRHVPRLRMLELNRLVTTGLEEMTSLAELRWLWISVERPVPLDLSPLEHLRELEHLWLWGISLHELDFLTTLPRLNSLSLHLPATDPARWVDQLAGQDQVEYLNLEAGGWPVPPKIFSGMGNLDSLSLKRARGTAECLTVLASVPLDWLSLIGSDLEDLSALAPFRLTSLSLRDMELVGDLSPLRGQKKLDQLELIGCPQLGDLGPLAELPALTSLYLARLPGEVDLAPLAGKRGLTVKLGEGQRVVNERLVKGTVKIKRF